MPYRYNAQRFLHRCTYRKRPQYWDEAVCGGGGVKGDRTTHMTEGKEGDGDWPNDDGAVIVHYSSSPKPWEGQDGVGDMDGDGDVDLRGRVIRASIAAFRGDGEEGSSSGSGWDGMSARGCPDLDALWRNWYRRSLSEGRNATAAPSADGPSSRVLDSAGIPSPTAAKRRRLRRREENLDEEARGRNGEREERAARGAAAAGRGTRASQHGTGS